MCDAIGPRMSAYRDSLAWDAGLGVAYAAYAGVLIFVGGLCRGWITGLGRGCAVEFMVSHVPKAGHGKPLLRWHERVRFNPRAYLPRH